MIPLRDTIRSRRFPWMNALLIIACIAIFLYEVTLDHNQLVPFLYRYGMVPAQVSEAFVSQDYVQLIMPAISAIFLHGGWLHLLGNMIFLWVFGDNIEDTIGSFRYLLFFLLVGLLANLTHAFSTPDSTLPTVGASGAVAGILGAYLIRFPRSKVLTLVFLGFFVTVIQIPAVYFLLYWFFLQLVNGVASIGVNTAINSGVAWWAHIGGFVIGAIFIKIFSRPLLR